LHLKTPSPHHKKLGQTFLISAMSIHGDGMIEGQLEILKFLNITEETIGASIISFMEVIKIGMPSFRFSILLNTFTNRRN
jgi:hypothetical protein